MRIFLSYSTPDRPQAEAISLALETQGHDVFFDRDDLGGGDDYNTVIRRRIADAQLFIFLISPASVRDGAYSLTELRFAREKWNHPGTSVLPVLVEPTPLDSVPAYLKSVTLFEPEGNVAAEVAARVNVFKRELPVRFLVTAAATLVVIAVIGYSVLRPGGARWEQRIDARDFISRVVWPEDAIERSEFALDPTWGLDPTIADSLVWPTRIAYGSISDTAAAMSITIRFRNLTDAPLQMDFDHRFFHLDDDQGRRAELLYFCCPTGAELLAPGNDRELQLIFAANPDWSGKETRAHRINLRVTGMVPLVSGIWSVPALATAQ